MCLRWMTPILLLMLLSSNQYHALLGSAEPPPQNGSASKGIAGCSIELRTDTERLDFNDYLHHAYFSVKKSLAKGQQGSNAIAKIRGRTRGIGNEFVLACDMRFASRQSTLFGNPEVGVGLIPGGGALEWLPALGRPLPRT
jgi:Enoyl-CoA hydratase/isomerase